MTIPPGTGGVPPPSAMLPLRHAIEAIGPRGRIGLVAIASDFNSEGELRRMAPPGVEVFTNRVANANPVTLANLRAMAPDITRAAAGILPGFRLDAMIYGCTSGTAAIGELEVDRLIQAARPDILCTNPVRATVAACAALRAQRISMLAPYIPPVNEALALDIQSRGLTVLNVAGFGLEDDESMTGVPAAALIEAGLESCDPRADLLFIPCTALRTATVIEELETRLGKPALSSNQALLWHALRSIGNQDAVPGLGRLFQTTWVP